MSGHESQWISYKINIWHPGQSWEPFWSYQLNSTAQITSKLGKIGQNWPNRQCCLVGSSKMAPRILIFSITTGANYLFYVKTIETHAHAFLTLIILDIGRVFKMSYIFKCINITLAFINNKCIMHYQVAW